MASYKKVIDTGDGYTTVQLSDGTTQTFTGSRGWRNNNPGNLTNPNAVKYYSKFGAIGADHGGNLIFSTMQGGLNAQKDLVFGKFKDRTIRGMLHGDGSSTANSYAPIGASNDPHNTNHTYDDYLAAKGWDVDGVKLKDLTPAQQNQLMLDMIEKENGKSYMEDIKSQLNGEDIEGAVGPDGDFAGDNGEGEDTVSSPSRDTASPAGTSGQSATRPNQIAPNAGEFGFKDPDNVYPTSDYQKHVKTNTAATGEWEQYLKLPEGAKGQELIPQDATPEYPHNKTYETPTGHRREVDDTAGAERVTDVHKIGSGREMREDGKVIDVAHGEAVFLTGDDFNMVVNGNGDVTYTGDLNLTVEGDMNLTVKGDMKTEVHGKTTEVYHSPKAAEFREGVEETVTGTKSVTTTGKSSEVILGGKTTAIKGDNMNWTEGNMEILSSGKTHLSAGSKMSLAAGSSMDMNAPLGNMRMGAGTMGGPGVYHYGYAWDGDLNVNGNINGDGNINGKGSGNFDNVIYQKTSSLPVGATFELTEKFGGTAIGLNSIFSGDGNTMVANSGSNFSAFVYVFEKVNGDWQRVATFTFTDGQVVDPRGSGNYGISLNYDGTVIAIEHRQADNNGTAKGVVSIHRKPHGGWVDTTGPDEVIQHSPSTNIDYFGSAVQLNREGNMLLATASYRTNLATDDGVAYIFEYNGSSWDQIAILGHNGGASQTLGDRTQNAAAISPDKNEIAIMRDGVSNTGAVEIWRKPAGGWVSTNSPNQTLTGPTASSSWFGSSIKYSGDGSTLFIISLSAIYVYTKPSGEDWEFQHIIEDDPAAILKYAPGINWLSGGSLMPSYDGRELIIPFVLTDVDMRDTFGAGVEHISLGDNETWGNVSSLLRTQTTELELLYETYGNPNGIIYVWCDSDMENITIHSRYGGHYDVEVNKFTPVDVSAINVIDNVFYPSPSSEVITGVLSASEEGVIQIEVDPGDKLKQNIDMRERSTIGKNK